MVNHIRKLNACVRCGCISRIECVIILVSAYCTCCGTSGSASAAAFAGFAGVFGTNRFKRNDFRQKLCTDNRIVSVGLSVHRLCADFITNRLIFTRICKICKLFVLHVLENYCNPIIALYRACRTHCIYLINADISGLS